MRKSKLGLIAVGVVLLAQCCFADDSVEIARGTKDGRPQQPQIAVGRDGGIHVVYGVKNEIRYRRSEDGGKSFGEEVALPDQGVISLGMRRGPRIAISDTAICVTSICGKEGKGRDGDLLALRSNDGGKNWLGPAGVNEVMGSAREGLHGMAAGPDGHLSCVWLDLRNQRTEVMCSISNDGGKTWQKNVLVYRSPDGNVCECCHPSVCFDENGTIFVMWRNSLAGARDMYLAKSADQGQTFGDAVKLGTETWPLDACPMDGGAIVAMSPDRVATVWRRMQTLYLLTNGETSITKIGDGDQPWIAATGAGPFVIWESGRGGQVFLTPPSDSDPPGENKMIELDRHGGDPVIASAPGGKGPVVAAWESQRDGSYTIQCQVVHPRD